MSLCKGVDIAFSADGPEQKDTVQLTNRSNLPRPLAAATTLLASVAAFASTSPFHSESLGTFSLVGGPPDPIFQVLIDHPTVVATPFAFASLTAEQTINFITPPAILGSFIFTAPSGDTLLGTYEADLIPLSPTESFAKGIYSFGGGTGAFAGASGTGSLTANIYLDRGESTITYDGTLSVPDGGNCLWLGLAGLAAFGRLASARSRLVVGE